MKINCRGLYRLMTKKTTDRIQVSALVKKVGSEAMTKAVDATRLVYTGFFLLLTNALRAAA